MSASLIVSNQHMCCNTLMLQVVVLGDGGCAVVVGSTDTAVVLAVEGDNGMF